MEDTRSHKETLLVLVLITTVKALGDKRFGQPRLSWRQKPFEVTMKQAEVSYFVPVRKVERYALSNQRNTRFWMTSNKFRKSSGVKSQFE